MAVHADPEEQRRWVLDAVHKYEAPLVRYAQRLVADEATARDVVQYAFLRLCDQRPEDIDDRMAQWLYAVCRNKAVDCLRSRQRSGTAGEFGLPRCESREPDPATLAEQHDLAAQLGRLIAELPIAQREAVSLWAEGLGYRDIAAVVETTEGNVRVLVHRAIRRLRQHPMVQKLGIESAPAGAGQDLDAAREVGT